MGSQKQQSTLRQAQESSCRAGIAIKCECLFRSNSMSARKMLCSTTRRLEDREIRREFLGILALPQPDTQSHNDICVALLTCNQTTADTHTQTHHGRDVWPVGLFSLANHTDLLSFVWSSCFRARPKKPANRLKSLPECPGAD